MSPLPRRLQPPALLASLLAPLLLAGAAAPVIAQMGREEVRSLPAAPQGGPTVRVLLSQASGWELGDQALPLRLVDRQGKTLRLLAVGERLTLSATERGVAARVISPDGRTSDLPPQVGGLGIEPVAAAGGEGFFAFGKERYRGRLQISPGEAGRLLAINLLPLETYLASVVGSEMPASWPLAALEAQAVAARTYALSQLKPTAAYDLKSTVASQAYRGLAAETDSTRAAVNGTIGQVLMQQGKLIQAVFHSSSGGVTEDSGQVWQRQLPYLVSVPDFDADAPVSRWTLRLEPEQLRSLFRETDGVRRIDVLASSGTGRVRLARVIGPAGAVELSGSELRQRLGLRSTLVTFKLQPVPDPRGGGVIDRAVLGSRTPYGTATWPASAVAGAGVAALASGRDAAAPVDSASGAILEGSGEGRPGPDAIPRPLFRVPDAASSPEPRYALLVEGRGFGHGVGMSQWGAYAMARQGSDYEQILRHYYRGVELLSYPRP